MKTKRHQNPVQVAMMKRHGTTTTAMRDRRVRRSKDARRSWQREWEVQSH